MVRVCGSDLWPYRGVVPTTEPHRIGHEFVGVAKRAGIDGAGGQVAPQRDGMADAVRLVLPENGGNIFARRTDAWKTGP